MKVRLAQHTLDCSGDPEAARESWRSQGMDWLAGPGESWRPGEGGPGLPAWSWTSPRWGAVLRVLHLVEPGDHGTRLHVRVEVEGPLAWLHRLFLQADLRSRVPVALRAVARALAASPGS
jgi:hypothetical protein